MKKTATVGQRHVQDGPRQAQQPSARARGSLSLGVGIVIACLAGVALGAADGHSATPPKLVGKATAGKSLYVSKCGVCHTMKAAGTAGTIGENLDKVKLTETQMIKAITLGGASVMTKTALAKFPTQMTGFKGTLTAAQIDNIAAFEYASTHPTTATK